MRIACERDITFLFCWASAAPLFFSFVRQLHAMYVLPAFVPLGILTAVLLNRDEIELSTMTRVVLSRKLLLVFTSVALVVIGVGGYLHFSWSAALISAAILTVSFLLLTRTFQADLKLRVVARTFCALVGVYSVGVSSLSPFVDEHRSAEEVLVEIAEANRCDDVGRIPQVGVATRNTYSHYWTSKAWVNELARQIDVKYVPPEEAVSSGVCNYLVKARSLEAVPAVVRDHFTLVRQSGDWLVFVRSSKVS